jgi:hypothetical protein
MGGSTARSDHFPLEERPARYPLNVKLDMPINQAEHWRRNKSCPSRQTTIHPARGLLLYKLSFLCSIIFIESTSDEMGSRNGVVHTANRYGLYGWGFDYLWEQEVTLLRTRPCRPWGPASFL